MREQLRVLFPSTILHMSLKNIIGLVQLTEQVFFLLHRADYLGRSPSEKTCLFPDVIRAANNTSWLFYFGSGVLGNLGKFTIPLSPCLRLSSMRHFFI